MEAMPKYRRARGARAAGAAGMTPMPPMPGKERASERIAGDESMVYGGGVRAMRANVAKIHGFGPLPTIEPEIERGVKNWITPMSRPNITKSSRDHRTVEYSGGRAAERIAPLLKAMREMEARWLTTVDWAMLIEFNA